MNDFKPLVSAIVVTYNCAKYVVETLDSIKSQTYKNIELIVSDDGSNDNTVALIEEWIEENKMRFTRCEISKPAVNTGTSANYNRGLRLARGEWIKFIAGDDALFPDTIEEYIKYAGLHPSVQVIHSNVVKYFNELAEANRMNPVDSKIYKINRDGVTAQEQFQILLRVCNIWTPTVMIKRGVFDVVGDFDEDNHLWEDRPMWVKITAAGIRFEYLDIQGAKYRVRTDSIQLRTKKKKILRFLGLAKAPEKNIPDSLLKQKPSKKIYPGFFIQINRVSYRKYLKHFPFFERQIRRMLYGQVLLVDKLNIPNNAFSRFFVELFRAPFNVYVKRVNKKYW
ncbi:MAG: glycosyltransferase [Chitinophagaceae bacterium]|nr:glycosyltransferase [Chitinophagaceae bacterium]